MFARNLSLATFGSERVNSGIFLKWSYHGWMVYFVENDASLFPMTFEKFLVNDKTTALCQTNMSFKR